MCFYFLFLFFSVSGWKCQKCEMRENLWLNLKDGAVLCGKWFFDGSGGNGHALEHYKETNYPLAVKLDTITPDGAGLLHDYLSRTQSNFWRQICFSVFVKLKAKHSEKFFFCHKKGIRCNSILCIRTHMNTYKCILRQTTCRHFFYCLLEIFNDGKKANASYQNSLFSSYV